MNQSVFRRWIEILLISTKLGLTSFGGPIAHLGYFREEYVKKRKWLDEKSYADLIALCQFLPGPASSQVGISIGMLRGGIFGGVLSWIGFTMPSVIVLIVFAYLVQGFDASSAGWINGLKIVAVAVVAQAVLGMGKKLSARSTSYCDGYTRSANYFVFSKRYWTNWYYYSCWHNRICSI